MSKASIQRKKAPTSKRKGLSKSRRKNGSNPSIGEKDQNLLPNKVDCSIGFRPDYAALVDTFNNFNVLIFSSGLSRPCFEIEELDTEWGYFVPNEELDDSNWGWTLGVRDKFPTGKRFLEVVLHEMVHVWQQQISCEAPNHNRSFTKWAKKIKEYGYEIH